MEAVLSPGRLHVRLVKDMSRSTCEDRRRKKKRRKRKDAAAWFVPPVPVLSCRQGLLGLALWSCGSAIRTTTGNGNGTTPRTHAFCAGTICSSQCCSSREVSERRSKQLTLKTSQMHPRSVSSTIHFLFVALCYCRIVIKCKAEKHGEKEMAENSSSR
jgi:hypothetical protein